MVIAIPIAAAHTPLAVPADRSISPSSSTQTKAIPSRMIGAAWVIRFARFVLVRNLSLTLAKMIKSTTRPPMAGSMPTSPPRTRCT